MMRRSLPIALLLGLLLTACTLGQPPSFEQTALASTPVRDLPVSIAYQANPLPTAVPQSIIDAADAEYLLLTNIYERVVPSVVNIDAVIAAARPSLSDQSSGSGMVYDTSGHIVTNAHVVKDAESILVTFHDGYVANARLVGIDGYSDLAVIKVDIDAGRLFPVTIGDSNALRVGERAIAIGNPFGLSSSMTVGIISGLGRQLPSAELVASGVGSFRNPSIIQVDAEINPGNSGGPLLNSRGEVIGVNTAIRTESGVFQGVGFAVPARTVQRVVPELIATGSVAYAWLGISSEDTTNGFSVAGLAEALELPVNRGVLIANITPGSPADKAGLRGGTRQALVRGRSVCAGGDIIVAVNGTYIGSMDELIGYLVINGRPGEVINLLIVRGTDTFDVPLMLEARPTNDPSPPTVCGR